MNMKGQKSTRNSWARRGQTLIEFTLVGIPLIFVLVSVFEISRGMWIYHTAAYSVKVGVRYASVHGINCGPSSLLPVLNTCQVKMGPASLKPADCAYETSAPATPPTIATVIWCASVGLDPNATQLIFTDSSGISSAPCALTACPGTVWPTDKTQNQLGFPISIQILTPFNSMLAMLWPGGKPVSFASKTACGAGGQKAQFCLPASSWDTIKF